MAPAKPVSLTFLVHPSRAPVGQNDVVSGVALPFDEFRNLVLAPATVDFQLTAKGAACRSRIGLDPEWCRLVSYQFRAIGRRSAGNGFDQ